MQQSRFWQGMKGRETDKGDAFTEIKPIRRGLFVLQLKEINERKGFISGKQRRFSKYKMLIKGVRKRDVGNIDENILVYCSLIRGL